MFADPRGETPGGTRRVQRTSVPRRAPQAAAEGGACGGSCSGLPDAALGEPALGRRKVCHLATSTIWDGEMLEEAAQRELAHLQRTHTCMPGLGSQCGESLQPGTAAGEEQEAMTAPDIPHAAVPQHAGASSGTSASGGCGGGTSPTIPGQPRSVLFVEGARWSGGAPAELPEEAPRRWRVRFSRAPSPLVGGPTLPAAASVGGEEQGGDGGSGQRQQAHAAPKRQRKPRQQLKAGAVSLPAPEPPAPAAATEPPQSDAAAAARWQEPPPLAPLLGATAGQDACSSNASDGIIYADSASQQLLVGPGPSGEATAEAAAEGQAEPGTQYRQPAEVLRLFSDEPPGARFSQPPAADLDVTFRSSLPVLVAWLLAERIVAPGQLAWSVLRGTLPPLARRPLHVLFWALFAAIVLWPFY